MTDKILIDRAVAEKALELLRESVKNPAQAPFNDLLAALVRVFLAVNDALEQQEPATTHRREWRGLDKNDMREIINQTEPMDRGSVMVMAEAILKDKNL
jgi:hypothetical protein